MIHFYVLYLYYPCASFEDTSKTPAMHPRRNRDTHYPSYSSSSSAHSSQIHTGHNNRSGPSRSPLYTAWIASTTAPQWEQETYRASSGITIPPHHSIPLLSTLLHPHSHVTAHVPPALSMPHRTALPRTYAHPLPNTGRSFQG